MRTIFIIITLIICFSADAVKGQDLNSPKNGIASLSLKVMTYNVHHCNPPEKSGLIDIDAIVSTIQSKQPDIVALQEIDVNVGRSGKINQARLIAEKLGFNFVFGKAIDYDGGEYGITIFSKLPLNESQVFRLPTDSATKGEPRILLSVKVTLPSSQIIQFCNTHLDAQKDPKNREMQIDEILRLTSQNTLPTIISGDFNDDPESSVISKLDKQFQRTCLQCDPTIPSQKPTKTIDFIAFSGKKRFKVLSHEVVQDPYSSDHLPVFAIVKLRSK